LAYISGNIGVEELKPIENAYLQRWPVSKRVNSSRAGADDNDATLILNQNELVSQMHEIARGDGKYRASRAHR